MNGHLVKQDQPLLGVALMVGFCVLAPMGDAMAKVLGETVPIIQLLLVRFAAQALLLLPFVGLAKHRARISRRLLRLIAMRALLHIAGIGAMFTSLRFLPLADAIAIAFIMPFIILVLGRLLLSEEVGPRRLIACVVGFLGTLLIVQPSFAAVGAPALLPLLVALVFALFMLMTRHIAKEIDAVRLQAVSGSMATVGLAVALVVAAPFDLPFLDLVVPNGREAWLLVAIGVLGTVAHLVLTWSLRFAPSATLAPLQYLEIPVATLFGWMIFKDLPNSLAAVGIAITASAGLFVVFRERAAARLVPPEA